MTREMIIKCFVCNKSFEHDTVLDEVETEIENDIARTKDGYWRTEYTVCPFCGSREEVACYELYWDELTEEEQEQMEFEDCSPGAIQDSYWENLDYDCYRDMQMDF